jgi:hypothetical protein
MIVSRRRWSLAHRCPNFTGTPPSGAIIMASQHPYVTHAILLGFAASFALALFAAPVRSADRALLVGVGAYRYFPQVHLDGIDLDIEMMKKVATLLRFKPRNIRVLLDDAATLAAVETALHGWVREGVRADDRVLIYFSSHGTQIPDESGDEKDGADEVLTMHDVKAKQLPGGQASLTGVLRDDTFGKALAAIASRNVLVMVDACHSGTVTRALRFRSPENGTAQGLVKYFHYQGHPAALAGGFATSLQADAGNHIAIAAAGDDEEAIATARGSLFTRGVFKAIEQANNSAEGLTPRRLVKSAGVYIAEHTDPGNVFHPCLSGNLTLADRALRLGAITDAPGPTWRKVEALVASMRPLTIRANGTRFREGELLRLSVDIPHKGYLNIVNIDAQDTPIVAFPNLFSEDNRVTPGSFSVPGGLPFELPAGPPFGPTLLAAFLTEEPLSLFETGDGLRDSSGKMLDYFPQVSELGLRGFKPTAKKGRATAAGMLEVTICPKSGCN